jgi:hypothetical protein
MAVLKGRTATQAALAVPKNLLRMRVSKRLVTNRTGNNDRSLSLDDTALKTRQEPRALSTP